MVSVFASSAVDSGFELRSGQINDYKIDICWKIKDWLAQNQDNMSEWGDMSIRRLLFQWASTIQIQLSALV